MADDSQRCDLCAAPLPDPHPHLVELAGRRVVCACSGCSLLLGYGSAGRYRAIPDRVRQLADFRMMDAQWEALGLPVDLAFFFWSTIAGRRVVLYPSPLGVMECRLPLDPWDQIVQSNPEVETLEPDVEALLIDWAPHRRAAYLLPIDACYRLVGLLRNAWRGSDRGNLREVTDQFFRDLRARSEVLA